MIRNVFIVLLLLLCATILADSITGNQEEFHAVGLGNNRSIWVRAWRNQFTAMYFGVGDPGAPDVLHAGPFGFGLRRGKFFNDNGKTYINTMYAAFCPTWFLMAVFVAYPVVCFVRGPIARFWRRPGLCVQCRYNLAGNTTGVCPECGTKLPEVQRTG